MIYNQASELYALSKMQLKYLYYIILHAAEDPWDISSPFYHHMLFTN